MAYRWPHDFGGDGPLLVLCHATGFCAGAWLPVAEHLRRHYRCIGLDFRGHGQTLVPAEVDMAWSGMADDLLAVIDRFADESPVFAVGHSMGGASIALAAERRPEAFVAAWAFEPILFGHGKVDREAEAPGLAQVARKRRRSFPSRQEAFDRYSSRLPLSLFAPEALWAYVEYGFGDCPDGTVELRCTPEREAEVFEHHNSGSLEAAGTVTFPFAIAASGDGQPPAVGTLAAAAAYPQLTLVDYPELTHFGPLQDPHGLAADIHQWFASLSHAQ
ncbi:MAG: alpha/beta hydrolase [Acidimicrobiales bacterium]